MRQGLQPMLHARAWRFGLFGGVALLLSGCLAATSDDSAEIAPSAPRAAGDDGASAEATAAADPATEPADPSEIEVATSEADGAAGAEPSVAPSLAQASDDEKRAALAALYLSDCLLALKKDPDLRKARPNPSFRQVANTAQRVDYVAESVGAFRSYRRDGCSIWIATTLIEEVVANAAESLAILEGRVGEPVEIEPGVFAIEATDAAGAPYVVGVREAALPFKDTHGYDISGLQIVFRRNG